MVAVARSKLDEWIRAYGSAGFEALCPRVRLVKPRASLRILALAVALKQERPQRTAAQVHQVMVAPANSIHS